MKKLITAILSLLTALCIAVGFSGCSKDEKIFDVEILASTAENPFYDIPSENMCEQVRHYSFFQEFDEYIHGDFQDINSNSFCYIQPYIENEDEDDAYIYGWHFNVFYQSDNDRFFLSEQFSFYDEKLGGWVKDFYGDELPPVGVVDYSVAMTFIFPTLDTKPKGRNVVIEFGVYSSTKWIFNKFINLYIDGICIGTCYYFEHFEVPQSWFADYFANKLRTVIL